MMESIESYTVQTFEQKSTDYLNLTLLGNSDVEEMNRSYQSPVWKKDVSDMLNKDVDRIRINAGKDRKIRPVDIMGALCSVDGLSKEDIGIIDIQNSCTYVELFNRKGSVLLSAAEFIRIKGKPTTLKKVGHRSY